VFAQDFPDFLIKIIFLLELLQNKVGDFFDQTGPVLDNNLLFPDQIADDHRGQVIYLVSG